MAEQKQKVNAKQFIEAYRSGKTDMELMRLHSLSPKALEKLVKLLQEKGMLRPSDRGQKPAVSAPHRPGVGGPAPHPGPAGGRTESARVPPGRAQAPKGSINNCPQCGAEVHSRALSCPECGHILSGAGRWEQVKEKRGIFDRIPPIGIGFLIAAPIAVALFFFAKDFMLSASQTAAGRHIENLNKWKEKGRTPMQSAQHMVGRLNNQVVQLEVNTMIMSDIFSAVDEEYRTFTAGGRWEGLSKAEKIDQLSKVRDAMRRGNMPVDFVVVNQSGETLATVTRNSINIEDEELIEGVPPLVSDPTEVLPSGGQPRPPRFQDSVRQQLQRR